MTTPQVEEEVHTEDHGTPEPPTAEVTIGDKTFQAKASRKVKHWEDTAFTAMQVAQARTARTELEKFRAGEVFLVPQQRRELEAQLADEPSLPEIRQQFMKFLFVCLSNEDRVTLHELWDSDLDQHEQYDSPQMYAAALRLFSEFTPYYKKRMDNMGFEVPEFDPEFAGDFTEKPANRAARRAAPKPKAANRKAR